MNDGHNVLAYREQYREELRTAILGAARELFISQGYEGFSMRKLAEKLGCAHGTLYLYFKNKQQLFDFLVEDSFAQLSRALERLRHQEPGLDPVCLLKEAGRIYVNFGRRNPNAYEFAFVIRRGGPVRPWKPHPAFAFLRNTIKACIEKKRFRTMNVDTATQAMWAAVHGVTSLLITRPSFPWVPAEELISRVIDSSVDSLLVPHAARDQRRKEPPVVTTVQHSSRSRATRNRLRPGRRGQ
jgi:AcrR family transcriptional regulator